MELLNTISSIPLFENFSKEEKQEFVKSDLSVRRFQSGDTIITEGEKHSSLYLLITGSVSVIKNQNMVLSTLKPGELFGEMSFLTKKPRHTSVAATEDSLVIRMDDAFFKKLSPLLSDKIKNFLIEMLVERLDGMNEAMAKIGKYASSRTLPG